MQSSVLYNRLQTGETVALSALEVKTIPHSSIISGATPEQIISEYKTHMVGLLSEVYQLYQTFRNDAKHPLNDIALELLWTTSKVENQPYNADILFFLTVRSIHEDAGYACTCVETAINLIDRELKLQKYETDFLTENGIAFINEKLCGKEINAIIKKERAEDLKNPLLPYCYSYDCLPAEADNLSKLIGILTNYPDCTVSFQLIPTMFTEEETGVMATYLQALNQLTKGVQNGPNTIQNTMAETYAETFRYYSEHKALPLYLFNVLVFANGTAMTALSSALHAQLANGSKKNADLSLLQLDPEQVDVSGNFYPLPWAVNESIVYNYRNIGFWETYKFPASAYRLPYIITGEEAAVFFRLPIGGAGISAGLKINESGKGAKSYANNIINVSDISVGTLRSSLNHDTIGFSLKDLTKHMLITGSPGSGKTTFSVGMLDRLWKEHNIPFLVIEPAKNEYRALIQSIPDIQIFTPGKNFISPFVYNPFVPPKNVKLESYKSTLKTAFSAAVPMQTPLDKIFEETINNCYSDFRWLDTYTTDDGAALFNIHDFINCFKQTFEEIGYTGDARNIGRAGTVRLNSLVSLFDNYYSIPVEDFLTKPTIIELAAIENKEQKSLIIALLLLSILSYINANYVEAEELKNVILLEEAHVLLAESTNDFFGSASPNAIAQELVKRMLAEIRAYGVGIVIADQSPKKVSTDVVALTDIKLTFRLVEMADRQIISDSTNTTPAQMQRLAKLRPGEAMFFFNKLNEPEEVLTENYRIEHNISLTLGDDAVASLSTYWKDKAEYLRPYPECGCVSCCSETCDYSRRALAREIARRIYKKNFSADSTDFEIVKRVFAHISKLIKDELNKEPFSAELLSCVKVHLWRRISYDTNIRVSDTLIENSLKK